MNNLRVWVEPIQAAVKCYNIFVEPLPAHSDKSLLNALNVQPDELCQAL